MFDGSNSCKGLFWLFTKLILSTEDPDKNLTFFFVLRLFCLPLFYLFAAISIAIVAAVVKMLTWVYFTDRTHTHTHIHKHIFYMKLERFANDIQNNVRQVEYQPKKA